MGASLTFSQDAGQLTLGGVISGSQNLTTAGAGTLVLSGANAYSGTTTVSAGTLLVNGSQSVSAVTVNSGAVLGGTSGTVGTIIVPGGTLSPGAASGGLGILNSGSVTFSSTAAYNVDLDGTTVGSGYDELDATGMVTIGPSTALNVALGTGFTPTVGNSFAIIVSPSPISGTFALLPEGATYSVGGASFQVSYKNDDVTLTCVATTTTSVSSSLAPSVYGQSVILTATVNNTSGSGGVPTGSVAFYDGSNLLGSGTTLGGTGTSATSTFAISTLTAGSHAISAVYVGTGIFLGNTSSTFTQTVNQAPLTITANNQTKVYGASLPTLTASYSGFVNGDTSANLTTQPTLTTTATASSHVSGSPYAITASGAVDSNYAITYVVGHLTVTTAPLTITAANKNKVYGAALPTLTATYSGFVNGDTSASLTTQPTLTTTATASSHVAGSPYVITAAGAVDSDYAITYVPGTLTVTTAALTITANNQTKVYGAALPTLTAVVLGLREWRHLDQPHHPAHTDHVRHAAAAMSQAVPTAITASGRCGFRLRYLVCRGQPYRHDRSADDHGEQPDEGLRRGAADAHRDVHGLRQWRHLGQPHHPAGDRHDRHGQQPRRGQPLHHHRQWRGRHRLYDQLCVGHPHRHAGAVDHHRQQSNHGLRRRVADAHGVLCRTGQRRYCRQPVRPAGALHHRHGQQPCFRQPLQHLGQWSVRHRLLDQLCVRHLHRHAGGTDHHRRQQDHGLRRFAADPDRHVQRPGQRRHAATFSAAGNTPPTISTAPATSHAGSYAITASAASDSDYSISYVAGTLTITPVGARYHRQQSDELVRCRTADSDRELRWFRQWRHIGQSHRSAGALTTATAGSHVSGNPYSITASGAVDSDYSISYVSGTLNVTAAPLTITALGNSKAYGAAVPTLTASYTGFVNGDTSASLTSLPVLSTSATAHSPVSASPYAIIASGAADSDYTISYVFGALTVTPAALTITANNQTKSYGAAMATLTVTYSGLVNGDTSGTFSQAPNTAPIIVATATASSHVAGSPYSITASGAVNSNYTISYVSGSLTVTPVALIITAIHQSKVYGAALPTLTASYSGFVNGDTNASLTTQPTLTTTATASSHVSGNPYTITAGGAADFDYSITYVTGSLTISPAALTITPSPRPRPMALRCCRLGPVTRASSMATPRPA